MSTTVGEIIPAALTAGSRDTGSDFGMLASSCGLVMGVGGTVAWYWLVLMPPYRTTAGRCALSRRPPQVRRLTKLASRFDPLCLMAAARRGVTSCGRGFACLTSGAVGGACRSACGA